MLSTASPRACGTLTHTNTRVEEPLKIAEVVVSVKSRIQEMSTQRVYLSHEASARSRGLGLTMGLTYSRNRVHVKLIEGVRFLNVFF